MLALFTAVASHTGSQLCAGPAPARSHPCFAPALVAAVAMASSSQQQGVPLTSTPAGGSHLAEAGGRR
eukprot:8849772-Lingulodinium_polyedra.AAC.1